jgi:ATP-dependent phosphoenolpyruvate carboxykinase
LEGGCYAKTINLSRETEPEIFNAIKRDALLENVYINRNNSRNDVDYFDTRNTENSRVSYPLYHISNYKEDKKGNHPKHIIFLTADAFGVLPPIARLTTGQAMYHFLSGYTAKVAGTERGVVEPEATFSACFGDPFLPLHPAKYADLFLEKLIAHKTQVYLVNTGWIGGSYGVGHRMSIQTTRSCIDAILNEKINQDPSNFRKDTVFNIEIPINIDGVDPEILDPRNLWNDTHAYDKARIKLAKMFIKNYKQYISKDHIDFSIFGPSL